MAISLTTSEEEDKLKNALCGVQVASVVLYGVLTSAFYMFCGPLLPDKGIRYAAITVYAVFAGVSLFSAILAAYAFVSICLCCAVLGSHCSSNSYCVFLPLTL
jgi:hypothetical protein